MTSTVTRRSQQFSVVVTEKKIKGQTCFENAFDLTNLTILCQFPMKKTAVVHPNEKKRTIIFKSEH